MGSRDNHLNSNEAPEREDGLPTADDAASTEAGREKERAREVSNLEDSLKSLQRYETQLQGELVKLMEEAATLDRMNDPRAEDAHRNCGRVQHMIQSSSAELASITAQLAAARNVGGNLRHVRQRIQTLSVSLPQMVLIGSNAVTAGHVGEMAADTEASERHQVQQHNADTHRDDTIAKAVLDVWRGHRSVKDAANSCWVIVKTRWGMFVERSSDFFTQTVPAYYQKSLTYLTVTLPAMAMEVPAIHSAYTGVSLVGDAVVNPGNVGYDADQIFKASLRHVVRTFGFLPNTGDVNKSINANINAAEAAVVNAPGVLWGSVVSTYDHGKDMLFNGYDYVMNGFSTPKPKTTITTPVVDHSAKPLHQDIRVAAVHAAKPAAQHLAAKPAKHAAPAKSGLDHAVDQAHELLTSAVSGWDHFWNGEHAAPTALPVKVAAKAVLPKAHA